MTSERGMPDTNRFVTLNAESVRSEHLCCALSGKKHAPGVSRKREFLTRGFPAGLTFRKLDARGKVFIEYAPAEASARPIHAPGYLVIHCLWVSGRFQNSGLGQELLQSCLRDSEGHVGVAAVSGSMIWLTNTEFYLHHGFDVAESTASGFDLVYLSLDPDAPMPRFAESARRGRVEKIDGVHFEFVHQCPLVLNALAEMTRAAEGLGLEVSARELATPAEVQGSASPFGTFGVFLHGNFLTHELLSETRFRRLLDDAVSRDS